MTAIVKRILDLAEGKGMKLKDIQGKLKNFPSHGVLMACKSLIEEGVLTMEGEIVKKRVETKAVKKKSK
ncbi:MAG TPA: hypothetical protein ENG14_02370 [Thermodesulforhabdus norvegica]|uniref:Uncharacterized protein n=1 Tax=Thermodesulforhabdus norvegica TaxID=39841 RepID=A0A7C1AW71_9BACT|nr:hypothetical protein [Thermodesulforhabdus norvegica]